MLLLVIDTEMVRQCVVVHSFRHQRSVLVSTDLLGVRGWNSDETKKLHLYEYVD